MEAQEESERAKPGASGEGQYFHINVRPKKMFQLFRTIDIGKKGHLLRIAGKRENGSWDTQSWLISKEDAHLAGNSLVPDSEDARRLLASLSSKPIHVLGDIFEAKDRHGKRKIRKVMGKRDK